MTKAMTECSVCMKKVEVMKKYNGEPMCKKCYHDPKNYVFGVNGEVDE